MLRFLCVLLVGLPVLLAGCGDGGAPAGVERIRIGDQEYVAYPVDLDAEMTAERKKLR